MANDKDVTSQLDNLNKQAKAARRRFEPEWFLCQAFFQNRQWVKWSGQGLQQPTLEGNRITVVENRIAGCVRTELAKMTKSRPVFTVTPTTGDEEDQNAAELGERVMRYMWRHLKLHELSLKALEWSRICGAGFLKCYWDSTIGDPIQVLVGPDGQVVADPQSGKPMTGDQQTADMLSQQLGAQIRSKRIAQGDIRVEVRSPFQMFVDPICDSFPEAEWAQEESIKSLEYAQQRYPDKANDLKADTPANPGLVESSLSGGYSGQSGDYKGVKIREHWGKPGSKFPGHYVWCQNTILLADERPFDSMPYVMLTGIPVPGRLWPMSIVELLRGPQVELNKSLSQMKENANRIGNPTLFVNKMAIGDYEQFRDQTMMPGGSYPYDSSMLAPGQLPAQYLEAPPLPEYIADLPQREEQAIEDISGQHEVTNANVPPGVTAASAITLLQEADDTRLGLAIQDYEVQIGRFGQKILSLVANLYTDARTIQLGGDDSAWEIFDFKGAMLRGNTHCEVQAGSAFPQSAAMKQAMATDIMNFLAQSGNAPHGRQLAQFLKDREMGGAEVLVQDYTRTETQVNRENSLMSLGTQLPINDYDDDQGHVDGHTEFQRAARYATFSPQIQQIFEQHVNEHRQRLSQIQQQELQNQLAMAGKVPPMLSNAAFQDEQQLAQLQGQQQVQGQAQQQGYDAAGQQQQQRQDAEAHQQMLHHKQQAHESQMQLQQQQREHQAEQHQARLQQMQQQAQQSQRRAS